VIGSDHTYIQPWLASRRLSFCMSRPTIDIHPVTPMPTPIETTAEEQDLLRQIIEALPKMEWVSVSAFLAPPLLGIWPGGHRHEAA
jgi:hypothetical protein